MEGSKITINSDKDKDDKDDKDKDSEILPKKRGFPKRLKKFTKDEDEKKTKKKKIVTEINEQLE